VKNLGRELAEAGGGGGMATEKPPKIFGGLSVISGKLPKSIRELIM